MKVFEDLIEELKDEDLIEATIFEVSEAEAESKAETNRFLDEEFDVEIPSADDEIDADVEAFDNEIEAVDESEDVKKRAIEECSSLQMVGHILAGIESEYMGIASLPYDDLKVKKALHEFVQSADDPESSEHEEARTALLLQIEGWYSALAERDTPISIADLRRFCENSKPVLSSRAMVSLARFYRNAPFSEICRNKYEYVMTRLFSREIGHGKRSLLFGRVEMIGHINTLYANWSSLSVFSAEEYSELVRNQTELIEEFAASAEATGDLNELLTNGMFEAAAQTKENLADMFFAPEIVAATIDCNLRFGNRFVELVHGELKRTTIEGIEEKFGSAYDDTISAAAGRTYALTDVARSAPEPTEADDEPLRPRPTQVRKPHVVEKNSGRSALFAVNKWLLAATILVACVSVAFYFWADQYESSQTSVVEAAEFNMGGSGLEKYLKSAKQTQETVYAVTMPDWEVMEEAGQKKVLQDALKFVSEKGAKKVQLMNGKGRTVGFAAEGRLDIYHH